MQPANRAQSRFSKERAFMHVQELIEKSRQGICLDRDEAEFLYGIALGSKEADLVVRAAYDLSQKSSGGTAQLHAQIGLDASPCERDCLFCSFASRSGLRIGVFELDVSQAVEMAVESVELGANLVLFLTTANFDFNKLLDVVQHTRTALGPKYPVLVSTDDFTYEQALQLKEAGCNGTYCALRLDEGVYTNIAASTRKSTIENTHAAGLKHCTCLDPIGPEHTPADLAERTMYILESNPVFGGAWRRQMVPGSKHQLSMIDEALWALYTAIFKVITADRFSHTATLASETTALAGANLVWAEIGTNPRDSKIDTENGLGLSIKRAKELCAASGWSILKGPATEWMEAYAGPVNSALVTHSRKL